MVYEQIPHSALDSGRLHGVVGDGNDGDVWLGELKVVFGLIAGALGPTPPRLADQAPYLIVASAGIRAKPLHWYSWHTQASGVRLSMDSGPTSNLIHFMKQLVPISL